MIVGDQNARSTQREVSMMVRVTTTEEAILAPPTMAGYC
jgi:hypothetical protein